MVEWLSSMTLDWEVSGSIPFTGISQPSTNMNQTLSKKGHGKLLEITMHTAYLLSGFQLEQERVVLVVIKW